jgi:formamidopyrimidine-DNA glycosylase
VPELPEIQALAERLEDRLVGSRVERLDVLHFTALKTVEPTPVSLAGKEIGAVSQRGKFLIFTIEDFRLLGHLSQGGRVVVEEPPKRTRPKGTVARLIPNRPLSLLIREFGTERKVGLWIIRSDDEGPLAALGPEPFSDEFEELILESSDPRRLHKLLRDQKTVAGIGRGCADDALHTARLSPYTTLAALGSDERTRLVEAVRTTLTEGLEIERQREGGLPPKLGDHWVVHRRYGDPCPRCDTTLRRVSFESYEITYCPSCQTGGKILADRRMSRLLR